MSQVHWRLLVAALWLMVLAAALGVVYGKQEARNRFSELQKLTTTRDDLDIEWGQLQLEQSTWATHGRVERVAHDELGVVSPEASELRIVQSWGAARRSVIIMRATRPRPRSAAGACCSSARC